MIKTTEELDKVVRHYIISADGVAKDSRAAMGEKKYYLIEYKMYFTSNSPIVETLENVLLIKTDKENENSIKTKGELIRFYKTFYNQIVLIEHKLQALTVDESLRGYETEFLKKLDELKEKVSPDIQLKVGKII